MTPSKARKNEPLVWNNLYGDEVSVKYSKFKVGDRVRIAKKTMHL